MKLRQHIAVMVLQKGARMAKRYEELEFTDRFMFAKILYNYPDLCRELLEFTFENVIDSDKLKKGEDYTELKKSYVIFICKNNPRFEVDAPVYMFKTMAENVPGVVLDDDRYTVFINGQYTGDDVSDSMKEFLHFIRTGNVDDPEKDDLTSRLYQATEDAKSHEIWRDDYMTLEELIKEENKKVIKETEERVRKETEVRVRRETEARDREKELIAISKLTEDFGVSKEVLIEKFKELMNS